MAVRLDDASAAGFMRAAGADPTEPYPGSSVRWRCRCLACGREITPRLGNVHSGHAPCSYCAGQTVDPGEAAAVMRAAGLEPAGAYPGAAVPWRCRCMACGRESEPRYASVSKGSGCRYCGSDRIRKAARHSPVAPAARSPRALAKAAAKRTEGNLPVHSFDSLLADLATICLSQIQPADPRPAQLPARHHPTPLQRHALELLGVSHRLGTT